MNLKKIPRIEKVELLKPYLITWSDAYQDSAFDAQLDEVSSDDHLIQHRLGFIIEINKKAIKICSEFCEGNRHIREVMAIPKQYVLSIKELVEVDHAEKEPEGSVGTEKNPQGHA